MISKFIDVEPCNIRGSFFVTVEGNKVVMVCIVKRPCLSVCRRLADVGHYVELWFMDNNCKAHLLQYWN